MNVKIQFRLRDKTSQNLTSIRLQFYIDRKRFTYSLGNDKRIYPELWDDERQRPIKVKRKNSSLIRRYEKLSPGIKSDLQNIGARIENLIGDIKQYFALTEKEDKKYDLSELKQFLDTRYEVAPKKVQSARKGDFELNEFIDQFISDIESGDRMTVDKKRYATGTIKNYYGFRTQFGLYQHSIKKKLRYRDITIDFYHDFVRYFTRKNYSQNTIGRHIKSLKVIMRESLDAGYHENRQFESKRFRTIQVPALSIYLTNDEVKRLYQLDLSESPTLELARDVFLVGCYTALRFSDYSRIKPEHIKDSQNGKFIDIITKKTSERVIIPIRPELETILNKYSNRLPKTYEQKINSRIKNVSELAGIDEAIETERIKGGLTVKKTVLKYELIKTHTARRTGATLMYLSDIPLTDIMKITGHKTIKNLEKYIKVTKEETAQRLSINPFFTGKTLNKV